VLRRIKLIAVACALGLTTVATAQADAPELELVGQPADRFERAIETHLLGVRYEEALKRARDLKTAPDRNLLETGASPGELREGLAGLERRIERARAEPDFGLAPGVSQGTLDAIAACESGGDPTAVNSAGYYGKYQFDTGTWASVGGSGNPAEASEAEQDYRASLLYSRAGSSPWPVCGA
jgi:soluble lytic murein transglycosylase-like protein